MKYVFDNGIDFQFPSATLSVSSFNFLPNKKGTRKDVCKGMSNKRFKC